MKKILIIEDQKAIVSTLKKYLQQSNYLTYAVYDGADAVSAFKRAHYDLILLDIMLPNVDGFNICKQIRKHSTVPIIMITARNEDVDKILGLEIGADDYIIKPFLVKEVVARVNALLRRVVFDQEKSNDIIHLDNLTVNLDKRLVTVNNMILNVTKKELDLLALFSTYPGKVFSRENLLDSVWGMDYFGDARTVDSHIKRLRAKLNSVKPPIEWKINTRWGSGYIFEVSDDQKN